MTTHAANPALSARDLCLRGETLYQQGNAAAAYDLFRQAAALVPLEPAYHYRLGSAAWKLGLNDEVERHYLRAVQLRPRHPEPFKALAQWSLQQARLPQALQYSRQALDLAPADLDALSTRATILNSNGDADEAWHLIEPLVEQGHRLWHLASLYSRLAPRRGKSAQACQALERALSEKDLSNAERSALHFSYCQLLDGMQQYDQAFAQAEQANRLADRRFDADRYHHWTSRIIDYFTPRMMQALPRATHGDARPLFIVGMPRSGTSLVEQILASHPQVAGGGELPHLPRIVESLAQPAWAGGESFPQSLQRLSVFILNSLAAQCLSGINAIDPSARYVTDKMPTNFEALWLAELLFPDSRVIHCIRDPRDTCLSCYFTDFAGGNAFAYDLGTLAAYHRDYQRLMAHWKRSIRLPMLDVKYEEVVSDLETQARRMVAFLGLPWDERCLSFHASRRYVATASFEQVRRPIYASSVGRWKHYARHLEALSFQ